VNSSADRVDVRRRAGWFPQNQDDLESWLVGHRERVNASGQDITLDPVLIEFRKLMDAEPVVRMHLNEMISQVPRAKQYSQRHLHDVPELLRLINEVLTMARNSATRTSPCRWAPSWTGRWEPPPGSPPTATRASTT